jgi:hypothetical protein
MAIPHCISSLQSWIPSFVHVMMPRTWILPILACYWHQTCTAAGAESSRDSLKPPGPPIVTPRTRTLGTRTPGTRTKRQEQESRNEDPATKRPGTKRSKTTASTPWTRAQQHAPISVLYNKLQAPLPIICPVAWPVVSPMAPARPEPALASSSLARRQNEEAKDGLFFISFFEL